MYTFRHMIITWSTHPPRCWMPVGVVVPLLWALVPTSLPIVVLTGVFCRGSIEVPVSKEESSISLSQLAVQVIVKVLVHAIFQISVAVNVLTVGRILRNGAAKCE